MKKIALLLAVLLLITAVGCGKTTKLKPRSVDITGDWTVKNPPKPDIKGLPKGYVPPTPTYMLSFSTSDSENRFALSLADKTSQGTYIISGTTIQLIPAGKNYVLELGATKKDDKILGDGLVWTRVSVPHPVSWKELLPNSSLFTRNMIRHITDNRIGGWDESGGEKT